MTEIEPFENIAAGYALLTGLEDGWEGCPITENPYPCYTEQWEDWLCGWEDGRNSG